MRLDEAAQYQDSFDAVENNAATSVQVEEVEAVIIGLIDYLNDFKEKVEFCNKLAAMINKLSPERRDAIKTVIDGNEKLPEPRISTRVEAVVAEEISG